MGYATLSYCWGSSPQLQTIKQRLPEFSKGSSWGLLPKTFVDAISMARAWEIPYIWIDSLCIVQDDEQEWQSEAAHIGDIFLGIQLTISAAQSTDSSQGCFPFIEAGDEEGKCSFRARGRSQNRPDLLVQVFNTDVRNHTLSKNIVSRRGWTLQEQLLSMRIVSCMKPEIHWQRRARYQTQSGLIFNPREMISMDGDVRTPFLHPSLGETINGAALHGGS